MEMNIISLKKHLKIFVVSHNIRAIWLCNLNGMERNSLWSESVLQVYTSNSTYFPRYRVELHQVLEMSLFQGRYKFSKLCLCVSSNMTLLSFCAVLSIFEPPCKETCFNKICLSDLGNYNNTSCA